MDVTVLEIPGLPGECRLSVYAGQIECLSYSHGVARQAEGQAAGETGRLNMGDFTLTKYMDSATPGLHEACCSGRLLGECRVSVVSATDGALVPRMIYTLSGVRVSSVSAASGGGDKPVETLTLNFQGIQWDYRMGSASQVNQARWSA